MRDEHIAADQFIGTLLEKESTREKFCYIWFPLFIFLLAKALYTTLHNNDIQNKPS